MPMEKVRRNIVVIVYWRGINFGSLEWGIEYNQSSIDQIEQASNLPPRNSKYVFCDNHF
jgi:hypothetical protein